MMCLFHGFIISQIISSDVKDSEGFLLYTKKFGFIFFIEDKPSKRGVLRSFIDFWYPRRYHFSRAFKLTIAPTTNLSETVHSSYASGNTINLTLLEAVYRDISAAIKLKDRSLEMFGEGFKVSSVKAMDLQCKKDAIVAVNSKTVK